MLALLSLLALQAPSLLPPAPAGWRGERLDFPLGFAPELDYRGVEDLLFAPGMFVPDSDSYFSYALALRLEGEVAVDEGMLQRFLETYYRGLCRAVAADRRLALDVDEIRARVSRAGEGFRATVSMFDAFTTGAALDLALELEWHAAPRATEILGLASPLDAGAPVWGELRALAAAWRAQRPAAVHLNHLFAVVDPETYAALAGSDFLRETFAVSEERTTVRADLTYSGLYLYGQHTYFEFLAPGALSGTGLALGVDRAGALEAFGARLAEAGVRSQGGPITRRLGDEELPWFRILGVEMPTAELTLFGMEYEPRFLERWHAGQPPASGGIARAAVLERYAAALGRTELRGRAPFLDVRAVALALSEPARARLADVAVAAGWEVEPQGERRICTGPGLRLELLPPAAPEGPTGVVRFELELRAPVAHEPLSLGRVAVSFRERTAVFELRP
ncbi:MAG TPA: DUF5829 family protein [Planctomycetota bacterium]